MHSGPEGLRHSFDAVVSEKDLRETYLPAFEACIVEAKAESIMAAYNRTNGEPCSGSPTLLGKILRGEWGFGGFVVSDCWAIKDFHEHHKVTQTWEQSAAMAVKAGCDLNCGCTYEHIPSAVAQGLLDEADIDVCLKRLFRARMRLGMFDPPARVPWASHPLREERLRRAPRAGAHGGARIDRAAEERGRPAAADEGRRQHRGHRPQRLRPARAGRRTTSASRRAR